MRWFRGGILVTIGESPTYAMRPLAHTNAAFTLSVDADEMDARDGELDRVKALVNGADGRQRARSAATGDEGGTASSVA